MEEKVHRAVCSECGAEANEMAAGRKCDCGGIYELQEYFQDESSEGEYDSEGKHADQSNEEFDDAGHSMDERESE